MGFKETGKAVIVDPCYKYYALHSVIDILVNINHYDGLAQSIEIEVGD